MGESSAKPKRFRAVNARRAASVVSIAFYSRRKESITPSIPIAVGHCFALINVNLSNLCGDCDPVRRSTRGKAPAGAGACATSSLSQGGHPVSSSLLIAEDLRSHSRRVVGWVRIEVGRTDHCGVRDRLLVC